MINVHLSGNFDCTICLLKGFGHNFRAAGRHLPNIENYEY